MENYSAFRSCTDFGPKNNVVNSIRNLISSHKSELKMEKLTYGFLIFTLLYEGLYFLRSARDIFSKFQV